MIVYTRLKKKYISSNDNITSEKLFVTLFTFTAGIMLALMTAIHILIEIAPSTIFFSGGSSLVMLILYYFVRFKNKVFVPKLILSLYGLIMLDFTWYNKFLSNGPILYFILIFGALIIWLWEGKRLIYMLAFYLCNMLLLFYIDHTAASELFIYPDHKDRGVDIFISLIFYSTLLILLLYAIKQEYSKQREKALESDRLKSMFLVNMSHEIRTPMNGIIGFSELLKEPTLHSDKQQEYIAIIQKSGERMLSIINDIIDISKVEAGLVKVTINIIKISDVFDYIYHFFKEDVEKKGIAFSYHIDIPEGEDTIKTDTEKLYAILINLVSNALKYTQQGKIEFGCYLTTKNNVSVFKFYIKDTGVGIAEDKKEVIFDRFIRTDSAEKSATQGAGLGLSITKAYVEMIRGCIWMESEINVGSQFYFTLPYKKITTSPTINLPIITIVDQPKATKKLKILIAEDDAISRILIVKLIETISVDYLIAKNGTEVVALFKANPDIDLILMDIQMPEINGYEATKLIRELNDKVIIIAQTANSLSGDKEKSLEAGCNDYLSKPIKKDELLDKIKEYL